MTTYEIEVGGQVLLCHGDVEPGDPGNVSGPPERCWPPEPPSFFVTKIELQLSITDDLSSNPRALRNILINITDLVYELGGDDVVQDLAYKAFEDDDSDFQEPEDPPEADDDR